MTDANFILGVLILVFNAGGFVWLARNHFHRLTVDLARLQGSVDSILTVLTNHQGRISNLEGYRTGKDE